MREFTLPDGITMEQLDAYAVAKEKERRRKWAQDHPDKVLEQRITTSKNLLKKSGFSVIPKLPPLPWDELTEHGIIVALKATMEQGGE